MKKDEFKTKGYGIEELGNQQKRHGIEELGDNKKSVSYFGNMINKNKETVNKEKYKKLVKDVGFYRKTLEHLRSTVEPDHINISRTEKNLEEARKNLKEIEEKLDLSIEEKINTPEGVLAYRNAKKIPKTSTDVLKNINNISGDGSKSYDYDRRKELLEVSVGKEIKKLEEDVDSHKRNVVYLKKKDGDRNINVRLEKKKLRESESKLKEFENWKDYKEEDSYFEREKRERINENVKKAAKKVKFAIEKNLDKKIRSQDEVLDLKRASVGFKKWLREKDKLKKRETKELVKGLVGDIVKHSQRERFAKKPSENLEKIQTEENVEQVKQERLEKQRKIEVLEKEHNEIEKKRKLIKELLEKIEIVEQERASEFVTEDDTGNKDVTMESGDVKQDRVDDKKDTKKESDVEKPVIILENSKIEEKTLAERFKLSLEKSRDDYDNFYGDAAETVAGNSFSEANRDVSILMFGIEEFVTGNKDISEDIRNELIGHLSSIKNNDPIYDKLKFNDAHSNSNLEDMNKFSEQYRTKAHEWTSSIENMFNALGKILPDSMVNELRARSEMFIEPSLHFDEEVKLSEEKTQENSVIIPEDSKIEEKVVKENIETKKDNNESNSIPQVTENAIKDVNENEGLDKNEQIYKEILAGSYENSYQLTSITKEVLEELVKDSGRHINLSGLTSISLDLASIVSKAEKITNLAGLKKIDIDLAKRLSTLNYVEIGAIEISAEVARELLSINIFELKLENISESVAEELVKHGNLSLSINNISLGVARVFSENQEGKGSLRIYKESIESDIIDILSKRKGVLDLGNREITLNEAEMLAKHEGLLQLGVIKITLDQLRSLSKHSGNISLFFLESVNKKVFDFLKKHEMFSFYDDLQVHEEETITKKENKEVVENKAEDKKIEENKIENKEAFPKTFYAQSPGGEYFERISDKYKRGSTMYELKINEDETKGEFYLYESESTYEDALLRHDSVLLFACNTPEDGIDKRTYSKVKIPEDGRGEIEKVDGKWKITKKAEIKLFN